MASTKKLAEVLLLRKSVAQKVDQLKNLKLAGDQGLYKDEVRRIKVSDTQEDLQLKIARIDLKSITAEYDRYAKALRQIDTAIQSANWQTDCPLDIDVDV